ncbi:DUF6817 domain-containing protein [Vibrio sp. 10N]|uniref:DUF6817 domain-containing protein n=1 Tax=Vibrio sp. 10N TaxID=3058938 RepID=UPI00281458CA|nr:hypothetical protein VB10N_33920 [Vibrio sp. 10N]
MQKFELLKALGAGDFQHLNGSLEAHLKGTAQLLQQWQARDTVIDAGLFHAAYGTAGFNDNMVSLNQRRDIADVIGKEAESLVYLYCSCDRDVVFAQFGHQEKIMFRDRFTDARFELTEALAADFCEITVANELELVLADTSFKAKYGAELLELFVRMDRYLSQAACNAYRSALAEFY